MSKILSIKKVLVSSRRSKFANTHKPKRPGGMQPDCSLHLPLTYFLFLLWGREGNFPSLLGLISPLTC